MSDKRFEIAPPDRDGRRCVCEWLEITREGERHVFEYFREYTPAPEAAATAITDAQWDALCRDIQDRRGLKWEWDKIDDDVKLQIRSAWSAIMFNMPTPEAGSAATPSDAVTRAINSWFDDATEDHKKRMTAALRTFAEALLEESDKTCKVLYSDERSLVNRVLTKAISNLLPEVTR